MTTSNSGHPQDKQTPHTGKLDNDFNKQGGNAPTQKHESQRTPESRHDREGQVGSGNQHQSRRDGGGSGGHGGAG
jgi:hypothetical protein